MKMKSTSKLKAYLLTRTKSDTIAGGGGGGTCKAVRPRGTMEALICWTQKVSLRPKGLLLDPLPGRTLNAH